MRNAYDLWFSKNSHRFTFPPEIVKEEKESFVLRFPGIYPGLICYIYDSRCFEVRVFYQGEFWDIIREFDLLEKKNEKGEYFCSLCLPEYISFYKNRQELWEKHSFEPFLEWSNENFVKAKRLYLTGEKDVFTSATIMSKEKAGRLNFKERAIAIIPLVAIPGEKP